MNGKKILEGVQTEDRGCKTWHRGAAITTKEYILCRPWVMMLDKVNHDKLCSLLALTWYPMSLVTLKPRAHGIPPKTFPCPMSIEPRFNFINRSSSSRCLRVGGKIVQSSQTCWINTPVKGALSWSEASIHIGTINRNTLQAATFFAKSVAERWVGAPQKAYKSWIFSQLCYHCRCSGRTFS